MTSSNTNDSNNPPIDYNYSRVLDVHIWCNYPEVNEFISLIYNAYFSNQNGKKSIAKKHIKLVLLDLYVAWLDDPDLCIAVNMTRDFYSKNFGADTTRYNELNISAKTINVVTTLKDKGLIGYKRGVEAQEGYGSGFISRIWAEPKLVSMFERSALNEFMIYSHHNREVLILRDVKKNDIEYLETEETVSQRSLLRRYNELLERTFIDIGSADSPRLEIEKKVGSKNQDKPHYVHISHKSKFTHRVFNNSSWDEGGRFYGGFWQRIGENYRKQILINDEDTVEIDFSSLQPVLAYANAGIDYWKEKGITTAAFAADMYAAPEFKSVYGSLTTEAQVNQIYKNLFDRAADVTGLTYWTKEINLGNLQLAEIAVHLIWAAQNNAGGSDDTARGRARM